MKKLFNPGTFFKLIAIYCLFILNQSCNNNPLVPSDTAIIEGKVVEEGNLRPIKDVLVGSNSFVETALTDENGAYSLGVQLPDSNDTVVSLSFSKSGFSTGIASGIVIENGKRANIPDAVLTKSGDGPTGSSGPASNVVLINIQTSNIFVKGSGANETSDATFEVRDANGVPVDLEHQVKVCFQIKGGPNGGEFVAPDTALTDNNGKVITTVNSGTMAGALQIVAEVVGTSIASAPVPISIHGGLPDINHFSVVAAKLNFAGYNIFGLENSITVFVGDKYSNPVPPGTSIQFQSTGGIIEGSALTNELGIASVSLISAAPQPQGVAEAAFPFNQRGFALVTAQTVDENQQAISKSAIVLFSGITQITNLNPTTPFSLTANSSQRFTFTVSDQNSNPLVAGTNINVQTNNGRVDGDTNVSLVDTQSRGATQFSFVLTNSDPDKIEGAVADVTVTITVSSQNGAARITFTGQMFP
ncbi:MAG: carboxypeptidase regulatory-like domain-containing protein [Caldithrix sp.]|nr:MAG: carboxypeptidase regulatory-like domain-containing protein [Caldithrix sp.]